MSELKDIIKNASLKASEGYLLLNRNMDDIILDEAVQNSLNDEIVKRICEQSNQNVYLSLFHDGNTDKSNITFDIANFDKIVNQLRKSENDMKDYNTSPNSFKSDLGPMFFSGGNTVNSDLDLENEKLSHLNSVEFESAKYTKLLSRLETMKVAEMNSATDSFNEVFHQSKKLTHDGESIADMAKIAMRSMQGEDLEIMKIAKVYDLISNELKNNGYAVNEEITKTSSLTVNKDSDTLKPIKSYMLSLSKIAGISDMIVGVKVRIEEYKDDFKKTAEFLNKDKS